MGRRLRHAKPDGWHGAVSRASDLMDELLEEAPLGAANAADLLIRVLAVILAVTISLVIAVGLVILLS